MTAANIRPATAADRPFVAQMLLAACFPPDERVSIDDAFHFPHYTLWLAERRRDRTLIAANDSRSLGAALLRRFHGHEEGLSGFVHPHIPVLALAVVEDARGQGLGSQLLQALIHLAEADGYPALSLAVSVRNVSALGLYRQQGFRPLDAAAPHLTLVRPLR